MEPIITARGLGKRYRISERRAAYTTFRDVLADAVRAPFSRGRRRGGELVWALRDVSFEVAPGRVTGIIGRNGAGKSTLLKILSRITRPTTGHARLGGRMVSLLEIGTGFHSELTGRRNVFLSGAILGMTRREIARNFDAIVAFADVEPFIDTPVKFYSTGMYLRLAFAVAAHLEAEIVAVDEVLAVGDVVFQRKCLGKMTEIAHDGRTVLLVSHHMAAVQSMADEVLVLDRGRLAYRGAPAAAIATYLAELEGADAGTITSDLTALHRSVRGAGGFVEGWLGRRPLVARHPVLAGDDLVLELTLELTEARRGCFVGVNIDDEFGVRVGSVHSRWHVPRFDLGPGRHRVQCRVKRPPLVPGHYALGLELSAGHERLDTLERVATLHVLEHDLFATGETPHRDHGYLWPAAEWTVTPVAAGAVASTVGR
jgi:lipopolysaccharide transport system ATP-binding protein